MNSQETLDTWRRMIVAPAGPAHPDEVGTYSTAREFDDLVARMGYDGACHFIVAAPGLILALMDDLDLLRRSGGERQ